MRLLKPMAILFVVGLSSLLLEAGSKTPPPVKEVTYTQDVAPILFKNCVVCHRPNDVAPMSLMTYEEVLPFARMIQQDVDQRKMPPWHADPHVGEFMNDARLSDAEIAAIDAWIKGGTKKGDTKDLPPAPVFEPGWHIKPDVVFTIPEFVVPKTAQDDYEYIYVPTNFTEDKWIQAGEVLPGDRRVVHHATVSVIDGAEYAKHVAEHAKETKEARGNEGVDDYHYRTGKVLHLRPLAPILDDGCAAPDGGGIPGQSSGYLNIVPAIYLPGHMPEVRPPGYALRIPAGSYLQFQIHYSNHHGIDATDHTSIGLVFAKEPAKHEVAQYEIWNNMFLLPPNDGNHLVTSCFTLPKDVTAVAYTAHMHFRGKSMTTKAIYPDGHEEVLMNIPHYDFRWQETYFLKKQFLLPKGTKLVTVAYFDNSKNNALNPDPSKPVRWGEPSDEEMMGFWLQFADPQLVTEKAVAAKE